MSILYYYETVIQKFQQKIWNNCGTIYDETNRKLLWIDFGRIMEQLWTGCGLIVRH